MGTKRFPSLALSLLALLFCVSARADFGPGQRVPNGSAALPFLMWSAGANNGFGQYIPVGSLPTSALGSQSANTVLSGPGTGAATSPTFRALVPLDIPAGLAGTGLTSAAGVLSVTVPEVIPAGAYYVSHANAGATAYVSDSALQNNGAQIGVGVAPATTDRVSVNPSGTAENGLTVTMPSGSTAYGLAVKDSLGNVGTRMLAPYGSAHVQDWYRTSDHTLAAFINSNGSFTQVSGYGMSTSSIGPSGGSQLISYQGGSLFAAASIGYPSTMVTVQIQTAATQTADAWEITNATGTVVYAKASNGGGLTSSGYTAVNSLTTPAAPAFATATTGGTLAPATYYYRLSAVSGTGETISSAEASKIVPAGTSTNTVTLTWTAIAGAEFYKVYGRTTGAELLIASSITALTYTDTGSITPTGALPAVNTTGYINGSAYQIKGVVGYTGTIPLNATGLKVGSGVITGYYTGGTTSAPTTPLVGN